MSKYEESTVESIGGGGQGSVQTIIRSWDQKQLVRKIIHFDTNDEKALRRVKDEYRIHRCLHHPNIARYIDAEWRKGEARFYMEYFENGSLDTCIKGFSALRKSDPGAAQEDLWAMMFQLSGALVHCHNPQKRVRIEQPDDESEHGTYTSEIYHRDIKPRNVLKANNNEDCLDTYKLSDFGLASILEGSRRPTTTAVGTTPYTPPEVFVPGGGVKWTTKCDIYSLGCTIYEMCNGYYAFKSPPETDSEAKKFTTIDNAYSDKAFRALLVRCLSRKPVERPEATELYEAATNALLKTRYEGALGDGLLLEAVEKGSLEGVHEHLPNYLTRFSADYKMYTPLHKAVQCRKVEIVKALLDKGLSAIAETEHRETPIHVALESTIDLKLKKLQLQGDLLHLDKEALHPTDRKIEQLEVLEKKDEVIAQALIKSWKEDEAKNWTRVYPPRHWTLLHLAAAAGSFHIVKKALEEQPTWDPITKNEGWSLLHIVARNGHLELLKFLLQRNQINQKLAIERRSRKGATPLFEACRRGQTDALSLLLKVGADVNINDTGQMTTLHVAALGGYAETVEKLLMDNKFGNARATTTQGQTALHLAAQKSHESCPAIIKALASHISTELEGETDINGNTQGKCTALHVAVEHGNVKGTRQLVHLKAKLEAKTEKRETALHIAARTGSQAIVQILLDNHANTAARNLRIATPLHEAIENSVRIEDGSPKEIEAVTETAKCLMEHDRKTIGHRTRVGETTMHLAAGKGNLAILRIVHEQDPGQVDEQNNAGETALHLAAKLDHWRIVTYLLDDADARTDIPNNKRLTPMQIATGRSRLKLRNYG